MAVISKPTWTFTEVQTHMGKPGRCYRMRCPRCGGLMVLEEFEDFELGSSADGFWGQRCINCGAIIDSVIVAHQGLVSSTIRPGDTSERKKSATSLPLVALRS